MKHLLDISTLVGLIWRDSEHHQKAKAWREGKTLVICPLSELGFLRVSLSPCFNADMASARTALDAFKQDERPEFLPCDISALDKEPAPSASKTTDWYLANLAEAHGIKLATFDAGISHAAADSIG